MSSGGSKQPANTTQTTTTIPKFAEPYAMEMLGRNQALNQTGYQQYTGQRLAGFNPMQEQGFNNIYGMQTSPQTNAASGLAALAGQQAAGMNYTPAQAPTNLYNSPQFQGMGLSYLSTNAPNINTYQMNAPQNVSGGWDRLTNYQMAAPERVSGGSQNLTTYQMGPAQNVSSGNFNQGAADAYMSPYMQSVVDAQKREAIRDDDIAGTRRGYQAATSGAFGGTRQAIVDAEAARDLGGRLNDIQSKGLQDAFTQAQAQFNADQARGLQAGMANQQAGLTTGQANLAAQLGVQQLGAGQDLQAALANQQAGLTTGRENLAALLGVQSLGSGQDLQAALANQQAGLTTGQANLTAAQQAEQLRAQLGMQSQQLNQAAQLQAQQQALGQYGQMNDFNLQNAGTAAQYGLAGLNFGEQSRQFGANYGMQGLQQLLAASGQLGQLGDSYYNQQMGINNNMLDAGGRQQALEQAYYDTQYQDFMDRLNFPYKQMGFTSDILHGLPTNQTSTVYGYPNTTAQAAGTLGGLASLYMAGRG